MPNLLSELDYFSIYQYSPHGTFDLAKKSLLVRDAIKNADSNLLKGVSQSLIDSQEDEVVKSFFNENTTLIPVPRSSKIVAGGLWPAYEISGSILSTGIVKNISACLFRNESVPKAAFSKPSERLTAQKHFDTIRIEPPILNTDQITLVDDIITAGATMFGCAWRLHELFRDKEIRCFAVVRTQSFEEFNEITEPKAGKIHFYPNSGKTYRD